MLVTCLPQVSIKTKMDSTYNFNRGIKMEFNTEKLKVAASDAWTRARAWCTENPLSFWLALAVIALVVFILT